MDYDVIVAGVGGMGSATVAELAARGVRVLGLDLGSIPNATGSSHGVNRIIRLSYMENPAYVPLLRTSYARWRALEQRLGEPILVTTGGVDVGLPDSRAVRGSLASSQAHDLEHELLEADELMRRYPGFQVPSDYVAVYQPDGGFVMSERAITAYARFALEDGADLHGHERVLDWQAVGSGVRVRTDRGEYSASKLIISAGAWVNKLVPGLDALAVPERQVLMWSRTLRPELFRVGAFPIFILDAPAGPDGPGGIFYGFPEYGIPGFKLGVFHHRFERIDPDDWDRSVIEPEDEEVLRACTRAYFPDADGPALTLATCMFTNTPDEHFIIDTLPDTPQVVLVSPCSGHGFKFASAIGEVAADLALDGGTDHDIEMFRLSRFATEVQA
jgi:sarcosine oxidase